MGISRESVVANSMWILSFFCPFMIVLLSSEHGSFWVMYAPIWFLGKYDGEVAAGPCPIGLLFFLWIPYLYIGYEFKRLVEGHLQSWFELAVRALTASALAAVMIIPMWLLSTGSQSQGSTYTYYIPLPVLSIIALTIGGKIQSRQHIEEPW